MRRFVSFGPAFVVLLTVAAVLFAGPQLVRRIGSAQTAARIVLAQQTLDDDDILERLNNAVRNVAAMVEPSVVHIEVTPSGGRRFSARSTGSGWMYDKAGHIVTNAHVVRGAAVIRVQFADGHVVLAEPIRGEPFAADPYTDIAVIKVPVDDDIFPIRRATGFLPQQGERVFAFGSPFGFKFSMSEGIISGLGRDPSSATEFGGFTNFIQTDAAVNPGNSGGPLVDIKGRIIGMNVAIATGRDSDGTTAENGQSAGISFAIPLGTIESVADQLIARGEIRRGFLGISFPTRSSPTSYESSVKATGVRVNTVSKDGPAEQGGLESGDVIISIAGQMTPSQPVLRSIITTIPPGQSIQVRVVRDGVPKEFSVTLGEFAETQAGLNVEAARRSLAGYGMVLREGLMRDAFRAATDALPPTIRDVRADSAAATAGFATGQLILQVGDTPVDTAEDVYLAAVQQGLLVGKKVPVLVAENGAATSPAPKTIDLQVLR